MVQAGELWIDRYEFPNRPGVAPKTRVDWQDAQTLCEKAGKRLCSEEEWERACTGGPGRRAYPYGATFAKGRCVAGKGQKGPGKAGSRELCASPEGAFDLSGNVAEWTSSQIHPGSPQRVIRGGYWVQSGAKVSCAARDYFLPGQGGAAHIGFRCCL
jgi:eukaryotic-like serine/threonine-protein kinase